MSVTRAATTVRTLTYDNAGNLLTDNGLAGNKTYTYNKRNRLGTATVGALGYAYTYNALEQLSIRQQTAGPSPFLTHFVHDIFGNVIAETAGGGATGATGTVREYIWLPGAEIAPTKSSRTTIDRPLAVVDAVNTVSPQTWWVSVDHLNRPVRMTTAAKSSVWDAVWQPWGGVQAITGSASLDARFPGQWFQTETGLHYNWHRSYDPTLGRYTQPDPLGFVDGPSVFGYAGGSPLASVDIEGRQTPKPRVVIVTEIIILARECVRDPAKCRRDLLCPGIKQAKKLACNFPGCGSPSMQPSLANFRMRAGDACLALRDAETAFCPLDATEKHKTDQIRFDIERKIEKCEAIYQSLRVYPPNFSRKPTTP